MAETNIIKTPDLGTPLPSGRTVAFVERFANNFNQLQDILNITNLTVAKNGIVQTQKFEVTRPEGDAGQGIVPEGDDIPLTHVRRVDGRLITVPLRKYRKAVTVEEVMRVGYPTAVNKSDLAVMNDISKDIDSDFFKFFGTDAVDLGTAETLQAAFGKMWGNVNKAFNTIGKTVVFVNPIDAGNYLGAAAIENGQSVGFGLTLLTQFTNVNVVVKNSVPEGTIYGTAAENLGIAIPELTDDVRQLFNDKRVYTDAKGLMFAAENSETKNATGETLILTGSTIFAEVTDGVFKLTLSEPATEPVV